MNADFSQYGNLLVWWFLPTLGSRVLLSFCYSACILTKPPPDADRRRNNHLQLSRTVVILLTLAYQLLVAISSQSLNYYQRLGLPLDVDADGVKRSFRALARRYHPDKIGSEGEAYFIVLRRAHDALSEPVKRFAYDRFGPQVADWKDCDTPREYMSKGWSGLVAFYTINPAMYAVCGYLNSRSDGMSFWRLACLFALLSVELTMLISPDYPAWLAILMPNTTIHDFLTLAHSLFVNFFFASLQLSAALDVLEYGEESTPARDKKAKTEAMKRNMDIVRLKSESIDKAADMITQSFMLSLAQEMRPFRESSADLNRTQRSKSPEEERIYEHIHDVLLTKGVRHRQPQLAQMAAESIQLAPPPVNSTSDDDHAAVEKDALTDQEPDTNRQEGTTNSQEESTDAHVSPDSTGREHDQGSVPSIPLEGKPAEPIDAADRQVDLPTSAECNIETGGDGEETSVIGSVTADAGPSSMTTETARPRTRSISASPTKANVI